MFFCSFVYQMLRLTAGRVAGLWSRRGVAAFSSSGVKMASQGHGNVKCYFKEPHTNKLNIFTM